MCSSAPQEGSTEGRGGGAGVWAARPGRGASRGVVAALEEEGKCLCWKYFFFENLALLREQASGWLYGSSAAEHRALPRAHPTDSSALTSPSPPPPHQNVDRRGCRRVVKELAPATRRFPASAPASVPSAAGSPVTARPLYFQLGPGDRCVFLLFVVVVAKPARRLIAPWCSRLLFLFTLLVENRLFVCVFFPFFTPCWRWCERRRGRRA